MIGITILPLTRSIDENKDKNIQILNIHPDYFSWKDYNGYDWTTPAKNQHSPKSCGSCWAFAAVGVLESCIKINENNPNMDIDLSEQYILSCLPAAANNYGEGCSGGSALNAFGYIMDDSEEGNFYNGIISESCMPYQADDDIPCEDKCEDWVEHLIPIYEYGSINVVGGSDNIDRIKSQIIEFGPVATYMHYTDDIDTWLYTHRDPDEYYAYPGPVEMDFNHNVVILGWRDNESIGNGGYWICKNSHGETQGYKGFFNIEYGSLWIDGFRIDWVSARKHDLKCSGILSWTDVNPGEVVYGNFTVENIGDSGSTLEWEIVEWPTWGEWVFNPKIGDNLNPEDGKITVNVFVYVNGEEEELFTGDIKIQNRKIDDDFEVIDISLQLSKMKSFNLTPKISECFFEHFPFLKPYFCDIIWR